MLNTRSQALASGLVSVSFLVTATEFALSCDDPDFVVAWLLSKSEARSEYLRYLYVCDDCISVAEDEFVYPTAGCRNLSTFL